MLAGVVLHQVKAVRPVQHAGDALSLCEGTVGEVHHLTGALLSVQHPHRAQRAPVSGLTASFGVEGGAVQYHRPAALLRRRAGADRRGELQTVGIGVKNTLCHQFSLKSSSTGQWSLPKTSGWMEASSTRSIRRWETMK